jgi:hypothetical protein
MSSLPTTRVAVLVHLADLLTSAAGPVPVTPHPPHNELRDEHIFAGLLDGDIAYPVLSGGNGFRDDEFTVSWYVHTWQPAYSSGAEALARCAELVNLIEQTLVDENLRWPDQLGVISALATRLTGPAVEPHPNGGWFGYAALDLTVHCRLS